MSPSIAFGAAVNFGEDAEESIQSSLSQQGSGEGERWGPRPAVSMVSCSISEFSQQEGGESTGLYVSQSGGQTICAAAAGPSNPTATAKRGMTR